VSDIAGFAVTAWTLDALPARFLRCMAVGYDRMRVVSTARCWTCWTVRRVHGMEEVRGLDSHWLQKSLVSGL